MEANRTLPALNCHSQAASRTIFHRKAMAFWGKIKKCLAPSWMIHRHAEYNRAQSILALYSLFMTECLNLVLFLANLAQRSWKKWTIVSWKNRCSYCLDRCRINSFIKKWCTHTIICRSGWFCFGCGAGEQWITMGYGFSKPSEIPITLLSFCLEQFLRFSSFVFVLVVYCQNGTKVL